MDAITLLKQDHKAVDGMFKKFEQAGDRAHKTKRKLVDQIITELAVHTPSRSSSSIPPSGTVWSPLRTRSWSRWRSITS